jgi:hypothetical protein
MAKKDRPWWGNGHTLWGGETFKSKHTRALLGIKAGDWFRIEQHSNNNITLIPHPENSGTWKDSHSNSNPIQLTELTGTPNERAYSMMVRITTGSQPKLLFFIERMNGSVAITDDVDDPGTDGGTASVER